eukprot:7259909-Prymnesium_polylepis.1
MVTIDGRTSTPTRSSVSAQRARRGRASLGLLDRARPGRLFPGRRSKPAPRGRSRHVRLQLG